MKSILLFTAPWCAPCKSYKPVVSQVCDETETTLLLADVTKDVQTALAYKVRSVPTTVILKEDGTQDMFSGPVTAEELKDKLK